MQPVNLPGEALDHSRRKSLPTLAAACLLSLVLGCVHAFSVFLEPLEREFGVSRTDSSLTYSIALVSLTLAVLFGHLVFARIRASRLAVAICIAGAAGALIAANATSLIMVWIGYGLVFGGANGLGYAFGLQLSAQASPGREGVAMGIVTAAYALGAAVSPILFAAAVNHGGFSQAMVGLTFVLVVIAPVCMLLLSGAVYRVSPQREGARPQMSAGAGRITLLWIGYGAGVAAGLMAIGHATGIATSAGLAQAAWIAPMIIAVFNLAGSIVGGMLVDRIRPEMPLSGLPVFSAIALLALAYSDTAQFSLVCLAIIGLAYGAIIASYPSSIAKLFGTVEGARIYGRVFTAWGTAGLAAPSLAGYLYDYSGDYQTALLTAAALAFVSTMAAISLFRFSNTNQRLTRL